MKRKSISRTLIPSFLLALGGLSAIGQIDARQMNTYSPASGTAALNRNRTDVPASLRNAELTVVPEDFANLALAPGFLLGLDVLDDSDFRGNYRIDQEGNIFLPVVGSLHVGGETASEARRDIGKLLLDDQILKNPQVSLSVLEYTAPEVNILGEVASPGKYPLLAQHRLVDVLALAGGVTPLAGDEVLITDTRSTSPVRVVHYSRATDPQAVAGIFIQPGQTVQVKRAGVVYVLGAVNRPGGYVMQEEGTLTVLQAIPLANGTAPTARIGPVYLLRPRPDGSLERTVLPYKEMTRGKKPDVQLQAKDVLYVPTSTIKQVFTNSQAVLSSVASASIYAAVVP